VLGAGGQVVTPKEKIIQKYYEQPKGMVSDTPTKSKPMPAPKTETVKTVQKMTPVAPKKTTAPQPKKVETKVEAEPTPVATFKPKTETTEKKGIDAALDGLE